MNILFFLFVISHLEQWGHLYEKNKTRLKKDANFPFKRHITSKIRRDLAKTRLILEQPLTPVLR